MDYEKHIKEFAIIAKEFCTWVEESDKQEQIQLYILQVMLSKLYCWGIQLPDCEATDFFQNENLPEHNHNEVLKYFKEFQFNIIQWSLMQISSQVKTQWLVI